MKNSKLRWLTYLAVLLMWAAVYWYYSRLPQIMPVHWGMDGQADGFMEKPWGALMLPVITTGMVFLLSLIPTIAPKGFRLDTARRAYWAVVFFITLFLAVIMVITYEIALGRDIDLNRWMAAAMGALFLVIGNYIGKFPKNFFVGIRTPWTLASDEVWFKTHRLGAWLFTLGGIVMLIAAWLEWPILLWVGIVSSIACVLLLYSLWLYKKLHGFIPENTD